MTTATADTTSTSSRPRITLRKGGLLILTAAATLMLGETVESVQLAYNSKTGAIGIRSPPPPPRLKWHLLWR